jgi:tungstate transport system substrate-binding protein
VALQLPGGQRARDVILATTSSTYDTGLLDSLVPGFDRQCGCRVKIIAVGTGQALALGARGEADVVLVHAPELERRYLARGAFRNRRLVMSNDFVLVGPPDDPIVLRDVRTLGDAMRRLGEGRATFVSRGDSSGTHLLELKLWREAGVVPGGRWYVQAGQGMGATLRIASEKGGYTLADRGTFLALRATLRLAVLFQGAPALLNLYHVMEVNPDRHPRVNSAGGRAFAQYLVSPEVQGRIASFGTARFGQPLFRPRAGEPEPD